jgi:SAM-dependent methyltransferase
MSGVGDFRSKDSIRAFQQAICSQPQGELCISIGGGPNKPHPNLVNLNLGPFQNVDVVADAYELPYADESVAAIHCEAVIEHLEFPDRAIREMYRVLKVDGQIFSATPFLQAFHACPNHFQNFTLRGHERLFERAGFRIISSGVCVGPNFAISDLVVYYLQQFIPTTLLSQILARFCALLTIPIRAIDLILNRYSRSSYLASTTYAHLEKPA